MSQLDAATAERLAQLERDLRHAQAMATQPKFTQSRKVFWQMHARQIQAQIEVIEELTQNAQMAFAELEDNRQEGLL